MQRVSRHSFLALEPHTLTPHLDPRRAWADAVGVFWLTRVLRDRDAVTRAAAARLLAALAHPRAAATRALLLTAWPEGGAARVRAALSHVQTPLTRVAALTFRAVAMASSTADLPGACSDSTTLVRAPNPQPLCSHSFRPPDSPRSSGDA